MLRLFRPGESFLLRLGRLVGLRAKVGSSGTTLREVLGEDWLNEGAEDHLSTSVGYQLRAWGH